MGTLATLGIVGGAVLTLVTVVKVFIPVGRWLGNVGSRFMGAIDNLAGRDERIDRATGKRLEAIPAIGERFAGIEEKLDNLANVNGRLDRIESRVEVVEATTSALIAGTYERGAHAALNAVEKLGAETLDVDPEGS